MALRFFPTYPIFLLKYGTRFSEKGVDRGITAAHDISQIYHVEMFLCLGLLDRRQRCRNRKGFRSEFCDSGTEISCDRRHR